MSKPSISSTRLETMWRCGEQYRRRYVEHEVIPPGIALLVGTGVHAGAQTNFAQKIETHVDLPIDEVIEAAVAGFESRLRKESYELTREEASRGARRVIAEATDQVAAMAEILAIEVVADYQPVAVEVATLVELPGPMNMIMVTDLRDDEGRVTDFKTAGRKKSPDEVHRSTQLTAYAVAYRVDMGCDPTEVRLDTLLKTKKVERQVLVSRRDDADYDVLAARIDATVKAIEAGIYVPTSPTNWQCSERWCGYARTCPYFSQRTSS